MENVSGFCMEDNQMNLPPGFRFHPTDEELISHYLYKKVIDTNFSARAFGEVDLNKSEPWELPCKAKMGGKQWYFFCVRDRKYPTGLRTNRATEAGYWKATGKDKEIYRGKSLVGMKKTLVFYKGRAPKGEKTNWVMHEYRLDGEFSVHHLPKTAKNEWVISRVFQKSTSGKKINISGIMRLGSFGTELNSSGLPPLTYSSPYIAKTKTEAELAYVPCFSNQTDVQRNQEMMVDSFNNPPFSVSSNHSEIFSTIPLSSPLYFPQGLPIPSNLSFPSSVYFQDQSILRALLENHGSDQMRNGFKTDREMISISQETGLTADMNTEISSVLSNFEMDRRQFVNQQHPSASTGAVDPHGLWNY